MQNRAFFLFGTKCLYKGIKGY